jgi:hypothetical protein
MASVREPTQPTSCPLLSITHPVASVVASTVSAEWDGVRALIVDGQLRLGRLCSRGGYIKAATLRFVGDSESLERVPVGH